MIPPTAEPAIEGTRLRHVYPGGVTAVDGVSLRAVRGELLAVVGPSGSGKSTLLQILGTLTRPTSGMLTIDGVPTAGLSDASLSRLRAHSIGFVFQQFHLSPLMSVQDNVAEGLLYRGVPHRRRQRAAARVLGSLGLGHRLAHRPRELSGGERQRTAIARAIVGRPPIVLADEPTGNLDSASSQVVVDILRSLANDQAAVILITHDHDVAAAADRVLTMSDGHLSATFGGQGAR